VMEPEQIPETLVLAQHWLGWSFQNIFAVKASNIT
jgi:hypothetical protein